MADSKLKMHPDTPDWAKPMWNLLAMVHQGNVDERRATEAVRVRVWHAENELEALKRRVAALESSGRDTMPAPSADDEPTGPALRVADYDGDPGHG
jgi:hypothetical protein